MLFKYGYILFAFFLLSTSLVNSQHKKDKVAISKSFSELKATKNDSIKVEKLISLYKQSIRQGEINRDIIEEALLVSEMIYYIDGIA